MKLQLGKSNIGGTPFVYVELHNEEEKVIARGIALDNDTHTQVAQALFHDMSASKARKLTLEQIERLQTELARQVFHLEAIEKMEVERTSKGLV